MAARGGGRADDRRRGGVALLLAASAWLYGVLLVLYPKAFRRRYSAEMRGDFRELSREGLREGGATGLARVWTGALWDLMITALKERITVSSSARRNAYPSSSVDPRTAAKAIWAVVLVAMVVTFVSSLQHPTYEAPVEMSLYWKEQSYASYARIQPNPNAPAPEERAAQVMAHAIESPPWPRRPSNA